MGLDVFRYGGWVVRFLVHGCLTLTLLVLSVNSHAVGGHFATKSEALAACESDRQIATVPTRCTDKPAEFHYRYEQWSDYRQWWNGSHYYFYPEPPDCDILLHEPSSDPDYEVTSCGSCDGGWIPTEGDYKPGSGSGTEAPYECMLNREPGECQSQGQVEVVTELGAFCVNECAHGMFNGVCLPPPEPPSDCEAPDPKTGEGGSSDYRGQVVLGYGKPPINACGDFDQCSGDKPGQVGFVNGELRCISEDYGVPQCKKGTINEILVGDGYGFACQPLENQPEQPEAPEEPNTDTDGDGQPDEYNPDNDPNINRKQLDDLNKGQDKTNKSLGNLEKLGKGTNDRLDSIGKELQNNSKGIGELVGFSKQINDKLTPPDGGLKTDGLGTAPELSTSVARLKLAFFEHPTIQAVTTIPTIGTSTSCPVWTIPANDYWDSLTLDVHCAILEDHRATLSMLFIFFWTVAAIFIFLRA